MKPETKRNADNVSDAHIFNAGSYDVRALRSAHGLPRPRSCSTELKIRLILAQRGIDQLTEYLRSVERTLEQCPVDFDEHLGLDFDVDQGFSCLREELKQMKASLCLYKRFAQIVAERGGI